MDSAAFVSSPKEKNRGPPTWRSSRLQLVYMIASGMIVLFYQRVSFSMAIVCMVNHTALDTGRQASHLTAAIMQNNGYNVSSASESMEINVTNGSPTLTSFIVKTDVTGGECQRTNHVASEDEDGPFAWDKDLQGLLLGALYWGYAGIQIPGSYVIQRLGARRVVGAGVVVMSLLHALCHPAAIFISPWAVFALRVGLGICTGLAIPAMYSVFGMWAPVKERAMLMSIGFAGQMIANASVFPLSALLCRHGFWGGWPAIFHIFGGVGVLWSVFWVIFMSNTPESHRGISPEERNYILATRSASVTAQKQKLKVPWRSILTSGCFWAIAVSQFTYNWGFFLMISNLPTFMYEAMNFDIKSNGVYSMLPYILLFFVMGGTGILADFVVTRRYLSTAGARKVFTCVGYFTPAVLLVVMSHRGCDEVAAVVTLLVVAVGVTGLGNTGGFYINPYDIAPRYATAIVTATTAMSTLTGVLAPYVVAKITKDKTREQWQMVFYITAGIFVSGALFFSVFARGEVQAWAALPSKDIDVDVEDPTNTSRQLPHTAASNGEVLGNGGEVLAKGRLDAQSCWTKEENGQPSDLLIK